MEAHCAAKAMMATIANPAALAANVCMLIES
jgi:hypothetical protein